MIKSGKKKTVLDILMYCIIIFAIGSIVGFLYEEIFYLVMEDTLVKRGYLFGPWLPIYGFGAVMIYLFLMRFKKHPSLVFALTALLTGFWEYISGFAIYHIWHKIMWDYSNLPFNIGGYVCLRSAVSFAIGGVFFIYLLEPWLEKKFNNMSLNKKKIISILIVLTYILDNILTFIFK